MCKREEAWIEQQRQQVIEYLATERVDHLGVGEYPAFHVHPDFALWAVQSRQSPGLIGWWAVSGDVPTDYFSSATPDIHGEALRTVARQWREWAAFMLRARLIPIITHWHTGGVVASLLSCSNDEQRLSSAIQTMRRSGLAHRPNQAMQRIASEEISESQPRTSRQFWCSQLQRTKLQRGVIDG